VTGGPPDPEEPAARLAAATTLAAPPRDRTTALPDVAGYRILRGLGEGGMGAVFLAEDVTLGRKVAIKVISQTLAADEGARTRFLREARAMATVEHPHVARIYSYGESGGLVHIVMEYVEGESLGNRIRRLEKLSIEEALQVVGQVAEALEAGWEKGIVHRDVKPSNVLIDVRGRVHVADFGLAKSVQAASEDLLLSQTGRIVGTPHYLSPEQARAEAVDHRSDVYSLGIVLYEMLAGAPPFQGTTPAAVVAQHLQSPLPPLREKRPDAPLGVVKLVEQMTAKDPDRRPSSYAALRKAIEESAAPATWTSGSPYRGLAAFDFEHAAIFFGRSGAVADVVAALRQQASSGRAFVLVLGMSGSGKSSLLRAGVMPALTQRGTIEGVASWRRAALRPGETAGDLFGGLAAALLRPESLPELGADRTTAREVGRFLRESPSGAAPLVKGGLSQAAAELQRAEGIRSQPDVRLALLVDQMEELFTAEGIGADERRSFIDVLSALARGGRVWVMATLRSDFYGRCEELPELMALKEGAGQYHLLPPTAAEIGQMIRQPARAAGLRFEQDAATQMGLDEVLRDSAAGQVGNLPLLEFALEELYRQRTADGMLTHSAYRSIGGVEGALSRRAEEVCASLAPAVQAALAEVFPALVRVESGGEGTFSRRDAPLDSFASRETRALVDAFVASRLFVAGRGADGRAVVSLAHEALLQSWPRLRSWLEENRELLRVRARVVAAAALWAESERPGDLLLAEGKPLGEALPLLRTPTIDLSPTERALVEASEARARRQRRARTIMKVNSVALLFGAAVGNTIYMWKVVPILAGMEQFKGRLLPLPVRLQIVASNWTVRLFPLGAALFVLLYALRRRYRLPDFLRSDMTLAVVAGVGLLLTMLGFLAGLLTAIDTLRWFMNK
jgi:predicted Ser/Thr protein kinase